MRRLTGPGEYNGTVEFVRRKMSHFNLSREEVLNLEAFLLDANKKSLEKPKGQGGPKKGRALFHVSRCIVCHSVNGRGCTLASDLSQITAKVNKTWLYNWIENPLNIHPKAKMPRFNFSEQQVLDIVAYIWKEFGGEKPEIPQEFVEISTAHGDLKERIARGERVFMRYGCADCHGKPGSEKARSPMDARTPGKYPF